MATTTKLKSTPSFPPSTFLPVPKKKKAYKVQRNDMKRAVLERYRPVSQLRGRQSRDDEDIPREECKELRVERETLVPNRHASEDRTSRHVLEEPIPKMNAKNVCKTIPESSTIILQEQPAGSCFLSFPRKKNASTKARKRNSAFHSPLRIAKYSFHSPTPTSDRTLSTGSTLDLVFSPGDKSPQIPQNETSTTVATNEIEQNQTDASESFFFDIEVVKSDSDTPAKMLEIGSVISKSSSSTLTSTFVIGVPGDTYIPKPFDEVDEYGEEDNRTLH